MVVYFLGREDFDFFVGFENTASCAVDGCSTTYMLAVANPVCLLALSHSDRHARASLLCAWLVALTFGSGDSVAYVTKAQSGVDWLLST